jgi:phospholipase/lecithinase/hemolysin
MKNRLLPLLLVVGLLLVFPTGGQATPFASLVAFGDSLSDDGNVARFTDGDIWVETLAASMGANLYNFAFGGATTGVDNPAAAKGAAEAGANPVQVEFLRNTGLLSQTALFLPAVAGLNMDETLFTVWAGANDFLQGRGFVPAALNVGTALEDIYLAGGRDILVGNLPDIGATPSLIAEGPLAAAGATGWTLAFNAALETVLAGFEASYADATLYRLDAFGVFSEFQVGTPEWADLFWVDGFHPSSTGHQLVFQTAAAAIPEPVTMLLLGSGLLGLAGFRRLPKRR